MMELTVQVPDGQLGRFYTAVGECWLRAEHEAGDGDGTGEDEGDLQDWDMGDEDLAAHVWRKFSTHAKAMFGLLMDHPGDAMTGEELAAAVGIPNGKYGVAGALAWPARHCAAAGRPILCRYEEPMTPDASGTYWIDQAVADLFRPVRQG
jgi:Family of unknown function (DUF6416)